MEIAVVGATAVVTLVDGTVTDARIAMTALSPTIRRVPEAEAALVGSDGGGDAVAAAAAAVSAAANPISDVRGSADYRRAMAAVIAGRAIETALGRAARGGRMKVATTLNVNGIAYPVELEPGTNLLAAVRDIVGLTGSKEGCDDSECGACMMLLDGQPVNSCSYLALQAEGSAITTVEGLADDDTLAPLQAAFLDLGGVQCGFCTPGMLVSATALLASNPSPTEDEVRIGLSGNLCRCTGLRRHRQGRAQRQPGRADLSRRACGPCRARSGTSAARCPPNCSSATARIRSSTCACSAAGRMRIPEKVLNSATRSSLCCSTVPREALRVNVVEARRAA